jgi:hypothetical protein
MCISTPPTRGYKKSQHMQIDSARGRGAGAAADAGCADGGGVDAPGARSGDGGDGDALISGMLGGYRNGDMA